MTKVPINPHNGRNASVSDPSTWADLRTAIKALKKWKCRGVGFVLTEDSEITFIDLDNIFNSETDHIDSQGLAIIERFDSYAEYSVSGRGAHIYVEAKLPPGRRRKDNIEMYDSARFVIVSGDVILDEPIKKKQNALEKFHREIFGSKEKSSPSRKATSKPPSISDKEVIEKASSAPNGEKFKKLCWGDWDAYPSQSEADYAFCHFLAHWTRDKDQLDRIFRESELMRSKWDEKHFSDGRTYGEKNIDDALDNVECYTDEVWTQLKELPQLRGEAPTLKPEMLPSAIRPWFVDAANRLQVPLEFCAAPAVVGLASLVGRNIGIYQKKRDDWIVIPNLWGACIGRPGLMKTPASETAFRPLDRLIAGARKEYKQSQMEEEADREIHSARMDALKIQVKKATKDNSQSKLDTLREELVQLTSQGANLVTYEKRYRTNDATVEKLGELLNQNPRGLFYYRDELTGWMRNLDRSGREGDREFFLEAWNGSGAFTVDRIGRGTELVNKLETPALRI